MGMHKTIKMNVNTPWELWPCQVVDEIQKTMEEGLVSRPHGEGWALSVKEQVNAAEKHLGDYLHAVMMEHTHGEDHLAHAFTRLMMAMAIERGYTDA